MCFLPEEGIRVGGENLLVVCIVDKQSGHLVVCNSLAIQSYIYSYKKYTLIVYCNDMYILYLCVIDVACVALPEEGYSLFLYNK